MRLTCAKLCKPYFISTPIFYVNAKPHIGHVYTALLADAQHRYRQLNNQSSIFITGTDEHGLKIQQSADKIQMEPKKFCDDISQSYSNLFKECQISYTDFIRTTDQRHRETVNDLWKRIYSNGFIEKSHHEGWYCVPDETFVQENATQLNNDGKRISLESGHPVEWTQEENYVFNMGYFTDKIYKWLNDENVIQPKHFKPSLNSLLLGENKIEKLSVSRPISRLQWGIPVPGDKDQIIYVWLDALANYLTGARSNSCSLHSHIVGKDILKFHAIYWPAFLMAAQLELPKKIFVHSHWLHNGEKMSKSKGNIIDPEDMIQRFSLDGFRYFLLREGVPHSDGNFNQEKMVKYLNAELANNLGNLLNRCTSKGVNLNQTIPSVNQDLIDQYAGDIGKSILNSLETLPNVVSETFENFNYYQGIDHILEVLRNTNAFVQDNKPWELKKNKDCHKQLDVVIRISLESLKISGILLQPIIPDLSNKLLNKLNVNRRQWKDAKIYDLNESYSLNSEKIINMQIIDITTNPALIQIATFPSNFPIVHFFKYHLIKVNGLNYICCANVDRKDYIDYIKLSGIVVGGLKPITDHLSLANSVKRVYDHEFKKFQPDMDSVSFIEKIKYASKIYVALVTKFPQELFMIEELKIALNLFSFTINSCIKISLHPISESSLDLHSIFITGASDEDENTLLRINKDTEIIITQQICKERADSLNGINQKTHIAGLSSQKSLLEKIIKKKNGLRGVLLSGPSGSGKTSLVSWVCQNNHCLLRTVTCGELISSNTGETEKGLKKLFEEIQSHSKEGPVILVLDGIEVLCPRRESAKMHEVRIFSYFAGLLDDYHQNDETNFTVIGITSRPQDIDPSVRRPGRLRTEIIIGIPNVNDRKEILELKLEDMAIKKEELSISYMADNTPGYLGVDLTFLSSKIRSVLKEIGSNQINKQIFNQALHQTSPSAFKSGLGIIDAKKVSWQDIGGLESEKLLLQRAIEWPLKYPEAFERMKVKRSKGCLLYGPPGCGKTKLVRAAASSTGVMVLSASAASIFSPYVGDSERAISELFKRARLGSPSILFIDEIDSLVGTRDGKNNGVQEKVLSTLLNEMDGVGTKVQSKQTNEGDQLCREEKKCSTTNYEDKDSSKSGEVIVVCATNRPHALDPALIRPGRLDQLIYIPPPSYESRVEILKYCTKNMKLSQDVSLEEIAKSLTLYSGADLENVCRESAMEALVRCGLDKADSVSNQDFTNAISKIDPSLTQQSLIEFERFATDK